MQVITTPRTLARNLWRYGEDDLVDKALSLSAEQVADIGMRAGELTDAGRLYLVVAAIEALEGSARQPKRARRRAEKAMPANLVESKDQKWADPMLHDVTRIVNEGRRGRA